MLAGLALMTLSCEIWRFLLLTFLSGCFVAVALKKMTVVLVSCHSRDQYRKQLESIQPSREFSSPSGLTIPIHWSTNWGKSRLIVCMCLVGYVWKALLTQPVRYLLHLTKLYFSLSCCLQLFPPRDIVKHSIILEIP